jgi:hypothetical protein
MQRWIDLPRAFCWTRFGTEAGEPIEGIFERKERERQALGGVFYWGIGNALGPAIAELVSETSSPEVLFSPIRSRPRREDIAPAEVAAWSVGETLDGSLFDFPQSARITSRFDPDSRRAHYALVCKSALPLALSDFGEIRFRTLRNLRSGRPLGSSQVTAVVTSGAEGAPTSGPVYPVALRAELAYPYFVRLRNPIIQLGLRKSASFANKPAEPGASMDGMAA